MIYNCTIEKDGDKFLVEFPDMPNVLTYGVSHKHALTMAKEALDGCLEVEILQGLPIRSPSFSDGYPVHVASHIALALRLRELRGDQSQTVIARVYGRELNIAL